jgi:hypothetical protein
LYWLPPRCPLPTRLHARPTGTTIMLRDRWRVADQAAELWTDLLRLLRVPQLQHCTKQRNTLIFGSPTWARTRDLRINSPSEKWPESRIQLGFPGFRLGNRLADFALNSPRSPRFPLFQFPSPLSSVALRKLVKFIARPSPEPGPAIDRSTPLAWLALCAALA